MKSVGQLFNQKNTVFSGLVQENSTPENNNVFFKALDPNKRAQLEKDPRSVISSFSKSAIRVLDFLIRFHMHNPYVRIGHKRIADKCGITRRHVIRILKLLREWGLIDWHNYEMSWYKELANEYKVSPLVEDRTFRARVGYLLGGLRLLSTSMLLSLNVYGSQPRIDSRQNVTSLSLKVLDINIPFRTVERLSIVNSRRPQWVRDCRIRYTKIKKGFTKEERRMKRDEAYFYAKNEMKNIKLTEWGCHNLAAFPIAALHFADERLGKVRYVVKDRYALVKSFCLDWCRRNNAKPDFDRVDELRTRMPEVAELEYYFRAETDGVLTKDQESHGYRGDRESQPQYQHKPHPNSIYAAYDAPEVNVDKNESVQGAVEILKAQGQEMNPFMRIMAKVDQVDKMGTPVPPVVVKRPEPVPTDFEAEDSELIVQVMDDYHKFPETDSSMMVLAKIGDIIADGPSRPEVRDGSFRAGLQHIKQVLDTLKKPKEFANSQ